MTVNLSARPPTVEDNGVGCHGETSEKTGGTLVESSGLGGGGWGPSLEPAGVTKCFEFIVRGQSSA